MAVGERKDPYLNFRFKLEIDQIIVGSFSEVSGLQVETETEEYWEGGLNNYVHKLPKNTKHPNISFKRGITDSDALWKWHQDVVNGKIERKNGRIILLDFEEKEKWIWTFEEAYPVKWIGPDFKADSNTVALEALELVHRGLRKG